MNQALKYLFWMILLVSSVALPKAGAHGHDGHDAHSDTLNHYVRLVELFSEALESELIESRRLGGETTILGVGVAIRSSAMNEVIALAGDEAHTCSSCGHEHHHAAKVSFQGYLQALPQQIKDGFGRAIRAVASPVRTSTVLASRLKRTIADIEAQSVRTVHQFDTSLATYVVVTQALWEGVETVVSNLVLPGANVHLACTVFNGMLLATTYPIDRFLKLARTCSANDGLTTRMRVATRAYSLERRTANNKLVEFSDGVVLFHHEDAAQMPSLLADVDRFFAPEQSSAQRWYIAVRQLRGMSLARMDIEALTNKSRHNQELSRRSQLKLEKITGRVHYMLSAYRSTLSYLASKQQLVVDDAHPANFKVWLSELIDFFKTFALFFTMLGSESRSETEQLAAIADLESRSERLLNVLQQLRVATPVRMRTCSQILQN